MLKQVRFLVCVPSFVQFSMPNPDLEVNSAAFRCSDPILKQLPGRTSPVNSPIVGVFQNQKLGGRSILLLEPQFDGLMGDRGVCE